jgi:hypothetical protein
MDAHYARDRVPQSAQLEVDQMMDEFERTTVALEKAG